MTRAFFFDFDGVILDSVDIKTEIFRKMFSKYGKKVADQVVAYHLENCGISRYEKFEYYYRNLLKQDISEAQLQKLGKVFNEPAFEKVLKADFILGALDFLRKYYKKYKLFIVSGTPENEIKKIVKAMKLDKYFAGVYGSPKTKQEILGTILSKFPLDLKHSYYFGDAKADLEAARRYHIAFVLIKGKNNLGLIKDSDICVKDFIELKEMHLVKMGIPA